MLFLQLRQPLEKPGNCGSVWAIGRLVWLLNRHHSSLLCAIEPWPLDHGVVDVQLPEWQAVCRDAQADSFEGLTDIVGMLFQAVDRGPGSVFPHSGSESWRTRRK
jgi:hypothetical protein